jgi:hypothetical protein
MHTCVVIAKNQAIRDSVSLLLKLSGLDCLPLASLEELPDALAVHPISGILLELATGIRGSAQQKKAVQEVFGFYPSAKFRFADNQALIVGQTFDEFVQCCLQFAPRIKRSQERADSCLAVYLSADPSFSQAEKSVTINVSTGGCFVYSVREWRVGDPIWLRFYGETTTSHGAVRLCRPWGNNKVFPGIGVRLDGDGSELPDE